MLKKLESDWHLMKNGKQVNISHNKAISASFAETAGTQVTEDEFDKNMGLSIH